MSKAKRQKSDKGSSTWKHHDNPKKTVKPPSKPPQAKTKQIAKKTKVHKQNREPTIPFDVFDNILLVGEGDLSFALSLLHDHGCASLTATTYDSEVALIEKYPHVVDAIRQIKDEDQEVMHDVDAQKLSSNKDLKKKAPFDRIIFNFPHIGGVSTDVNRQVRANQALLAAFFQSSIALLKPSTGTVLVTLFESEPYTLWNVRDLARHAGLTVLRSWKFEREVYPLYKHARTAGVIKNKAGEASDTAWKGEDRAARTYEFGLKEEEGDWRAKRVEMKAAKKRKARDDDDSDDENDDKGH